MGSGATLQPEGHQGARAMPGGIHRNQRAHQGAHQGAHAVPGGIHHNQGAHQGAQLCQGALILTLTKFVY